MVCIYVFYTLCDCNPLGLAQSFVKYLGLIFYTNVGTAWQVKER